MHLVLGPDRIDLRRRVLVVGAADAAPADATAADLAWVGDVASAPEGVAFGADAETADDVRRAADAGAVAVGLADPNPGACALATDLGLAVLVGDAASLIGEVDPERLLVPSTTPVEGGVALLDLDGTGPASWARATVALGAGVRVVRTAEVRSIRRVATVVERLVDAGASS